VVLGRSTDTMANQEEAGIVFTASITRWSTMSSRPSQLASDEPMIVPRTCDPDGEQSTHSEMRLP